MHRISMAAALCLTLAFGSMAATGGTAAAQEAGTDTHSVRVSLHGIDLGTAAGREQAAQRIAYAVRRDYRASNAGSVITVTDAAADENATLATAMSKLQRLEAAVTTRPAPFAVATSTRPSSP